MYPHNPTSPSLTSLFHTHSHILGSACSVPAQTQQPKPCLTLSQAFSHSLSHTRHAARLCARNPEHETITRRPKHSPKTRNPHPCAHSTPNAQTATHSFPHTLTLSHIHTRQAARLWARNPVQFPIQEKLLRRYVKRFRGGLVLKAHRLLHHATLGSRIKEKKKNPKSDTLPQNPNPETRVPT